jgi:methylaspartate mutase sigma subunit
MVGRQEAKMVEEKFRALGFDRVYPPNADLEGAIADLRSDLKAKGKM